MQEFSGIWVPVVTPFADDGRIDAAALAALVEGLVQAGVHGLVACGTTGEAATLDDEEKAQVLETVLSASAGLPVVMGVTGVSPVDVARQCDRWNAYPIAGFLVPPPAYVRPSQQGIIDFYARVASAAAPRAVVVYDIPYRTGTELALPTLRALARIPGIRAIKDCAGDARKTQALIADGQLNVLAGEDHQIFTTLCQGGSGAIAASAHLHPRRFVALFEAVKFGPLNEARAHHHALAPMVNALFAEPNPGPLKAVLAALGQTAPTVRAPMTPAGASAALAAWSAYEQASAPHHAMP
ncbi:4-hydroxy-tetrahydrodipicolinate synthase [Piscinibacter sp.]|uniref:4-hydroxy-tetrahydrodipicolinate synthase n=1 Tax=Piscinibacter sp. TaxID=1903157 RepID=UPI002CCD0D84|nr:4-hydroxy-tetrahydrodipicolinate synthase [Albitalea sp.]HUG24826.1 4-hydroxy-tetrahydrodipicolinate synthase [Albitalea sp.]